MDAPGQLAQLPGDLHELVDRLVQQRASLLRLLEFAPGEAQGDAEIRQPGLGAVVQVVLQPAAGVVSRLQDPSPRRAKLRLPPLAVGDVPQVAGEHGRPRKVDASDRQLDRELAPVGAHTRQLADTSDGDEPTVAQGPNAPWPGRVFLRVEQNFRFAPSLRTVARTLQETRLGQLRIVGQIESEHAADDGDQAEWRNRFTANYPEYHLQHPSCRFTV